MPTCELVSSGTDITEWHACNDSIHVPGRPDEGVIICKVVTEGFGTSSGVQTDLCKYVCHI